MGQTVEDLRKRLDRAEERVLALTVQPAPATPQPAPELLAVVDQLRKRLEESEARNQALVGGSLLTSKEVEEPLAMVVELHKRRRQADALVQAVEGSPASQAAQERPSEVPAGTTPAGSLRGLLARLLGR
jgi:hypothetical protein